MFTATTTTTLVCDVCGKRREFVSSGTSGDVPPGWGWVTARMPFGPADVCSAECAKEWAVANAVGLFQWQAAEEAPVALAVA